MFATYFNLTMLTHFLIGSYFVFFAIWNIYHWNRIIEIMSKDNFPHPYLLLSVGIGWQAVAGFMLIFGLFIPNISLSKIHALFYKKSAKNVKNLELC